VQQAHTHLPITGCNQPQCSPSPSAGAATFHGRAARLALNLHVCTACISGLFPELLKFSRIIVNSDVKEALRAQRSEGGVWQERIVAVGTVNSS
jgi:hypothetical protein